MPPASTVLGWVEDNRGADPEIKGSGFSERYASARTKLLENMADELLEIADDGINDWMEVETKSGRLVKVPDQEHIQRSRLRVETRKWLLSKLRPDKYGDKTDVNLRTPDSITVNVRSVLTPPDEKLQK